MEIGELRLLLDTNVIITLEPFAGNLEPDLPLATRFVRLANEQHHRLLVHPATVDDLVEGKDPTRRRQRLAELEKFARLAEGAIPATLVELAGESEPGSNDHRDLRILAALRNRAASYLVSNDNRLLRRARRAGLGESVLTLPEAVALLESFAPVTRNPPPRVERLEPYLLDAEQAIFDGLRADYAEFDLWLDQKVRPDSGNRECLIVRDGDAYAGIALVKRQERDCRWPFGQPITKLATFKVGADHSGSKYGELLLKTIFADAHDRGTNSLYVEVLPKHERLIDLLDQFGFVDSGYCTDRGEHVLLKHCEASGAEQDLPPLDYHIAYGPPAISGASDVFIVPVLPVWHDQLFPDAPGQMPASHQLALPGLELPVSTHPWGNALRKAYICNSPTTLLSPGATLLFYRTTDTKSVVAIGVMESSLRSSDPDELITYVGNRTVYTPAEISAICGRAGGALAMLFRQDRFVEPAWSLDELVQNDIVKTWPQSITRLRKGGTEWVLKQLTESP